MTTRDGGQQPHDQQQWGEQWAPPSWGPPQSHGQQPYPQQPHGQQWGQQQPYGQQQWGQQQPDGQQQWGQQQPYGQHQWGQHQWGRQPYGQQAWGGQGPGGADHAAYGAAAPTAPDRPQEIEFSFYLWIASVVLGLVGSVIAFTTLGSLTEAAVTASGGGPESEIIVQAITVGIVVGAVVALGFVVLQVVFSVFLRRGRNWARITLAVLGGFSVLFTVIGALGSSTTQVGGQVIETGNALTTTLSLLQAAVIVGAIVLSFRPAANRYVAAVSSGAR